MRTIPFNRVEHQFNEIDYIKRVLMNGHISGDGEFTVLCNELIEKELGVKKVFLTTSCTHALEMAAMLLDIKLGDEIIIPSFTFVSTVNAFVLRGATPIFIDIRPDTLNMDEKLLEGLITKKTKAIVPVHYAGVGCEMDMIVDIANNYKIPLVEDNAHGLFGKYKGKNLGTFGYFATQSFHATKNFTCGEGGALLINDESYVERAEIIREKGTNRAQMFRGEVDKYSWVDIGSSYLPSDILAAHLYSQLENRDTIQHRRKIIWGRYQNELSSWANKYQIGLPIIPDHCQQAYHLFYLIMPSLEARTAMMNYLASHGISSAFHYLPLNTSKYGKIQSSKNNSCPVTEDLSNRLIRLPFFNSLDEVSQNKVIQCILSYRID